MQIELSASGTPAQVSASVADQVKAAVTGSPDAWPTLVSVRDYVARHLTNAGPSDSVTVTAAVSVEIAIVPAAGTGALSVGAPVAEPEPHGGN